MKTKQIPRKTPKRQQTSKEVFRVSRGGKQKEYNFSAGFGYFIAAFKNASTLKEIDQVVQKGISSQEITPIVEFLDYKVPDIAKATSVSTSTVLRWEPKSSIGIPGTNQFFKIDEVIRKGMDLFGGEEEFKTWLNAPVPALGNQVPSKIMTSQIGVELVDEALEALHFGNVM